MRPPFATGPALRPRHALLLAGLAALPATLPAAASAAPRTITASELAITNGGLPVRVMIDASLHNQARIDLASDTACLAITEGKQASLTTQGCEDDAGQLTVFVPPGLPLTLTSTGDGKIAVDDTRGPLTAHLASDAAIAIGDVSELTLDGAGSGDVRVAAVHGPAALQLAGDGTVRIGQLSGPLRVHIAGSGTAVIGNIDAPNADIQLTGSGDALIGNGHIGALTAISSGSGDLAISAIATSATLTCEGSGDIRVADVKGEVLRKQLGSGEITIGGSKLANAAIGAAAGIAGSVSGDKTIVIKTKIDDGKPSRHHDSDDGPGFSLIFLGICGFVIYRTMKRNNAWPPHLSQLDPRQWRRSAGPAPTPAPSNLAVRGLAETLTRLEERAARLENFVTTREFDLHRQFRDLDRRT